MAIPKLALIPSGYKAGKLYSVLPTNGDGDFTTTRNTVATRVNENGLIEEVAANVPRLDYSDGGCPSLLLENSSTNLVTYSEDLNTYLVNKTDTTITDNYGISPSGQVNSSRIQFADATSFCYNSINISTEHTASAYVKGTSGETVRFGMGANVTTGGLFTFNGLWQRIEYTSSSASQIFFSSYGGATTTDFEAFGAQLEQNSYSTSYIKTVGTAQTRSADTANGAGNASTFNDSEGVLMAEINYQNIQTSWTGFGLTDGNASADRIIFATQANTNNFKIYLQSGGTVRWNPNVVLNEINQFQKIAVKYKSNDVSLWMNGFEVASDNTVSIMPTGLDSLGFFGYSNIEPTYGNTKQIQYFDSALNDSDLEKITSWTSFTAMANGQSYTII